MGFMGFFIEMRRVVRIPGGRIDTCFMVLVGRWIVSKSSQHFNFPSVHFCQYCWFQEVLRSDIIGKIALELYKNVGTH